MSQDVDIGVFYSRICFQYYVSMYSCLFKPLNVSLSGYPKEEGA